MVKVKRGARIKLIKELIDKGYSHSEITKEVDDKLGYRANTENYIYKVLRKIGKPVGAKHKKLNQVSDAQQVLTKVPYEQVVQSISLFFEEYKRKGAMIESQIEIINRMKNIDAAQKNQIKIQQEEISALEERVNAMKQNELKFRNSLVNKNGD